MVEEEEKEEEEAADDMSREHKEKGQREEA